MDMFLLFWSLLTTLFVVSCICVLGDLFYRFTTGEGVEFPGSSSKIKVKTIFNKTILASQQEN